MMINAALVRLSLLVWRPMLAMLGLGIAVAALWVAQSITLASIVAALLAHEPIGSLGGWFALILAIVAGRAVLIWGTDVTAAHAGLRIKSTLRQDLFLAAARKGRRWLTVERTAAVESALTDGVDGLEAYYARYLPQIAVALTAGLGTVIWIGSFDPIIAIVLLSWHLAVPILPRLWETVVARVGTEHWDEYRGAHADFLEAMQGSSTLKTLGAEETVLDRLQSRSRSLLTATLRQMRVSLIGASMSSLLVGIGTAVTIAAAILRADSLGTVGLLTVLFLTGESFRPFSALAALWHQSYMGFSAAGAISELREGDAGTPADSSTRAEVVPGDGTGLSPSNDHEIESAPTSARALRIEFSAVSYTYPGAANPALHEVSFTVEAGEHLGVVGRSGAGKSTLIALLLGEIRPSSGAITIDGIDLATIPAEELRSRFGVVHQQPHLFTGTLGYNLGIGLNPEPAAAADSSALSATDRETIRTAAVQAGLTAEITALGLDAEVGEWGRSLSGGQRQRIALARALVHRPTALVLDEATASVEHAKETTILESLRRAGRDRTVISITHRHESLIHCDRILTVDAGRVTDVGDVTETEPAGRATT